MLPITTQRLLLRDFSESDFEALHAFASDPDVTRFTSFGPNTPEATRAFLASAVARSSEARREEYSLAVQLRSSGALIGSCGLGNANHGQYEIGYVLAKAYWGRGLATELVGALAAFAFRTLNARKVWAPVDAANAASRRVLEKTGFRREGFLRQDRLKWPEGRDTALFGLLAEEWPATAAARTRGGDLPAPLQIRPADLSDGDDAHGVVSVLDTYARDPRGGGRPLAPEVRERLVPALRDIPNALALLAFADERAVGLAVCFFGFSTFRAMPLLNVHDLAVVPRYRARGIGRALLAEAEKRARDVGCCKLTLEVQDDNRPARSLYRRFGFEDFVVGSSGPTRFLSKPL